MSKPRAILIHGNGGGTAADFWIPSVGHALTKLGVEVIAKDFPDADLARESYWLPFIDKLEADQNTIIIGHSSGAVAAMRYAEKHPLLGSVLVGASYTDLDDESERLSGYYDRPWDWEAIRRNQQWIIQFASADDPYIPIEEARHISEHLQSEYHEIAGRGHYMVEDFPELIEAIKGRLVNN